MSEVSESLCFLFREFILEIRLLVVTGLGESASARSLDREDRRLLDDDLLSASREPRNWFLFLIGEALPELDLSRDTCPRLGVRFSTELPCWNIGGRLS